MLPRTLPVLVLLLASSASLLPAQSAPRTGVSDDIRHLAADRLQGRRTGEPGADSAAEYIARRFAETGLRPAASLGGWFQAFSVSANAPAVRGGARGDLPARNVVGVLRGSDPRLADEYIVVGAHYDHLGLGGHGSLEPDSVGAVHNGADDNASGVAALLAIARRLAPVPPARSVLFLAFGAEELGLLGSVHYVKEPVIPNGQVLAMLNFDMVGRLRDDRLIVFGAETAGEWRALLDSLNAAHGFVLTAQGDGYGRSDHNSFTEAGRPVLHFFTGTHEDYHRPTDDWDRVNVRGIERIAAFASDLVRSLGSRGAPLTLVSRPAPPPSPVGGGYGAYLGTVPDMSDTPGGVRLSGVRAGSPAEQAGLQAGDILIRIGDFPVADLQAMTDALRRYRPGDVADVVVRRDGEERVTRVTFGRRGG